MTTELSTCGEWRGISPEEYHARIDYIGHGMLDCFRENPARFHGRYVAQTIPADEPTESMKLGSLVHLLVLEPHRWGECAVIPQCDKRTKEGKAIWEAFCAENEGKQLHPLDRYTLAQKMAAAVLAHDEASQLLALDGPTEDAIWWTDEETGLKLKSLRDKATSGILCDLKTCHCASPEEFARACHKFGYHRQNAHYADGHEELTGERDPQFYFIAVENVEPHSVGVYQLDDEAVALGRKENRAALNGLKAAFDSGDWLPPFSRGVNRIRLPRYAMYADWE